MTYNNREERDKKFAPNDLPTSMTREIYIHYSIKGIDAGRIEIWDCDLSGENRILLHKMMVSIKIPQQQNLKTKVIEALENEIEKIQAETHRRVTELKERVESLLCIEYRPQEPADIEASNVLPF